MSDHALLQARGVPLGTSESREITVLKLGGSLLSLPDLTARIGLVIAQRPETRVAVVVGGGAAAELVREWDRVHHLGDEVAHYLALQSMRLNGDFVARLLSTACIVTEPVGLDAAWTGGDLPLLDAGVWLSAAEAAGRSTVPHTWQATSDSIAAWLAAELGAAELVLLKSVPRPVDEVQQAVADGLVDAYFPDGAAQVPHVSWVNLRSVECWLEPWISN